jgi:hypothetical protein
MARLHHIEIDGKRYLARIVAASPRAEESPCAGAAARSL